MAEIKKPIAKTKPEVEKAEPSPWTILGKTKNEVTSAMQVGAGCLVRVSSTAGEAITFVEHVALGGTKEVPRLVRI